MPWGGPGILSPPRLPFRHSGSVGASIVDPDSVPGDNPNGCGEKRSGVEPGGDVRNRTAE